jgi:subtilisin family serine protease
MKNTLIGSVFATFFCFGISLTYGQDAIEENKSAPEGWHHYDRVKDQYNGVSTEQAYSLLNGRKSRTVIVAVIDSGVDIDHEDLRDYIWVNDDEIAGNGIDDDKNGFVDDINGWNFIGDTEADTYEVTRLYAKYFKRFGDKSESDISKDEKEDYEYYLKLKKDLEWQISENKQQYEMINQFYAMFQKADKLIKAYLDTDELDLNIISRIESPDQKITGSRDLLKYAYENNFDEEEISEYISNLNNLLEYGYNPEYDPRPTLVGDNYNDPFEKYYGDNNVKGGSHGTQVAGVIAAGRNNGIGMNGIADNVRIMAIKAVPDGDERDKDVANAIIYAVDNGAHIINMSFGKSYSPEKEAVDKAIQYADSKGVLMVHASGNDHNNIDEKDNFPNRKYLKNKEAKNWLEVGASSWGAEDNFVANFSNYGKKSVDIFAPGVAIYATSPDDEYDSVDGTSFASPLTAGVAALIMSYYPEFSANQVKDILLKSSVKFENMMVNKPDSFQDEPAMIEFSELSKTGGIINAFEAVKMAESMMVKKN